MEGPVRKKNSARIQWDTKPRRAVNPKDIDFQTAEIVIPSPARDQSTTTSFGNLASHIPRDRSISNRLIWGDNILAMQALLTSGYEGKINLIYIDPPFWTGENYYATFKIENTEVTKAPSVIERLAYTDIWEGGIDSFFDMLYPRLHLMKRLLADNSAIFVHLDYHVGHYVKVALDEIFGMENFKNEIIWQRTGAHNDPEKFGIVHDSIFFYGKGKPTFNEIKIPLSDEHINRVFAFSCVNHVYLPDSQQ